MKFGSYLDRARRGAAHLDALLGPGWRRKIRRRRLNMASGWMPAWDGDSCGCILAQLSETGNYNPLEFGVTAPVRDGFAVSMASPDVEADYEDLTEAWRQVLREGPA